MASLHFSFHFEQNCFEAASLYQNKFCILSTEEIFQKRQGIRGFFQETAQRE